MILYPTYFSPVIQYVGIANTDDLLFETQDNYQKQTYRNRCYIYGANGKQLLTVPIINKKTNIKQKSKDIRIDNSPPWQKLHIKSLQSAYRSSPFFEFYEDDVFKIFNKKHTFLLDLNFEIISIINDCLQLEIQLQKTLEYKLGSEVENDFRDLVNAKDTQNYLLKKYTQVFDDKHGFISNLSILDLLFNEGPNALEYLENHEKLLF